MGKSLSCICFRLVVLHENASCIIGPGVVVDPFVLLEEIAVLKKKGMKCDHIRISDRAHIIMPYHVYQDELQEKPFRRA